MKAIYSFICFFLVTVSLSGSNEHVSLYFQETSAFDTESWVESRILDGNYSEGTILHSGDPESWVKGEIFVEDCSNEETILRAGGTEGGGDPNKMPVGSGVGILLTLSGIYFVKLRAKSWFTNKK